MAAVRWLGLTAAFYLAYTQLPLYSSNQNTYFLWGLARSGLGQLAGDWSARTTDPVPVFSWLVWLTQHGLPALTFKLLEAALFGVCLWSLQDIAAGALGIRPASLTGTALATAFILVCSGALGSVSERLLGANLPRLLERGVAGQYLLGSFLQPSCFGVWLLAAVSAAARARYSLAIAWVALAATVHPTYLLPAGLVTLTILGVVVQRERSPRRALVLGLLALVLVAPITAYTLAHFRPGPPAVHAEAARILVHVRLPHHADVATWFDAGAAFQLLLMVTGLALARGSTVFPFLFWPFAASAGLTLAQVATHSDSLALLFPWRFSAVLVPVSTTLLLGRVLLWLREHAPEPVRTRRSLVAAGVAATLVLLAASGVVGTAYRAREAVQPEASALFQHVHGMARAGDLYWIPTSMESFRIATGAPVFVDEKNHPFRDDEIVEWYRRILWSRRARGAAPDSVSAVVRELLAHYPITRVVAEPGDSVLAHCDVLEPSGRVGRFALYDVRSAGVTGR